MNKTIPIAGKFQILAKGHNVPLEIAIPMEHTTTAKDVTGIHVPENGGTCG
jgi:hypothetical protein